MAEKLVAESIGTNAKPLGRSRHASLLDEAQGGTKVDASGATHDATHDSTQEHQRKPGWQFLHDWLKQFVDGFRWPTRREAVIEEVRKTYKNVLFSPVAARHTNGNLLSFFVILIGFIRDE